MRRAADGSGIVAAACGACRACDRTSASRHRDVDCRLTLVDAGLPEPELNYDGARRDRPLSCVCRPGLPGVEDRHRVRGRAPPDRSRRSGTATSGATNDFTEAGWQVIRVTKDELFGHAERRRRVRVASRAARLRGLTAILRSERRRRWFGFECAADCARVTPERPGPRALLSVGRGRRDCGPDGKGRAGVRCDDGAHCAG